MTLDKKEKIFSRINVHGKGLEIGPSHNPMAPKSQGYDIEIIDHLSKEDLQEKYRSHGLNIDNIEEVDYIWSGENFEQLTGKSKYYDYIIASHVIEHTPDLIAFLKSCESVLKEDGVLSLVIPDKRYCFDYYRPVTGLARIVDSHYQKNQRHTVGSCVEYFLNVVSLSGQIAWDEYSDGVYSFVHSLDDAQQAIKRVENQEYIDVHAWCFTPSTFRLLMHDLYILGFTELKEVCFYETFGCEFYISLGRSGNGINTPRLDLLSEINRENVNTKNTSKPVFLKSLKAQTISLFSKIVYRLKRLKYLLKK
jgi:hypothetical protein